MAEIHSIRTLWERGWSQRRIARELDLDRETVRRHLHLALAGDSKPAKVTAGYRSLCAGHQGLINQKLDQGLSAQRIWQDLVSEVGFSASYESVKRFVQRLCQQHPERVWRLESDPGEEMQVDFGEGARLRLPDGHRQKTHAFRTTLSYSRKGYSECVLRQTTELFIRCLESSFHHFGGVPARICIDNLKAAVTRADWYDPEIHPKILEFCRHYGTTIMPTRPRCPQHKGKIESGVNYVQDNALKGREFEGVAQQNRFLLHWETTVADLRIHGTTRQQVQRLFLEKEKAALRPLPTTLFPFFHEGQRSVHRDSFIEVEKSYYEVPEEYIGRELWVRWDTHTLRVFNQRWEQIAMHARVTPGQFARAPGSPLHKFRVEHAQQYWLKKVAVIGVHCGAWAEAVLTLRGPLAIRVFQGVHQLTRHHTTAQIDRACESALQYGAYRLRDLRRLLQSPPTQVDFGFLETHPLIRDLSEYGTWLEHLNETALPINPQPIYAHE